MTYNSRDLLIVASFMLACSAEQGPNEGPAHALPVTPFVISSPVPRPSSASAATMQSESNASTVVYVSLPPGAIPEGHTANILDRRVGSSVSATIVDGGFDPVPLVANVGDTVKIVVQVGVAGGSASYAVIVPDRAPPKVVRTSPPPHKRDVPLNAIVVVVFSQPIDPATVTTGSVQLSKNGTPVAGTVRFSDSTNIRAEFQPVTLLVGNTDYQLVVSQSISDVKGLPLDSTLTVPFTTGNLALRYSIGGTVSGLTGTGLALQLNGGEALPVTANGPVTFATTLVDGAAYSVTVLTLPASPAQLCVVAGGAGTVAGANVTDIVVSCSDAAPSLTGQMVFTSGSPRSHIMLLDLDGATITQLTNDPADDRYPQWSPDRSRIAFLRLGAAVGGTGGLWVMSADGSGAVKITELSDANQTSFCWSPDGTKFALMDPASFSTINADGSGAITLQDSLGGTSGWGYPAWSPDGSTIVFAAFPPNEVDWFAQVYLMDADGSNVRHLSLDNTYHGLGVFENAPAWSPDGTRVVYWSAMYGITVINRDGTGAYSASHDFFNPGTGSGTVPAGDSPDWSPDGTHLVYRMNGQLFATAADGSEAPQQLTSVSGGVYDLAWFR